MVVMPAYLRAALLKILLNVCVKLLRPLQVSGLEILPQLAKRLRQWALRGRRAGSGAGGGVGRAGSNGAGKAGWKLLRKGCEVRLRLRQIAGLQILPQLLEFAF